MKYSKKRREEKRRGYNQSYPLQLEKESEATRFITSGKNIFSAISFNTRNTPALYS